MGDVLTWRHAFMLQKWSFLKSYLDPSQVHLPVHVPVVLNQDWNERPTWPQTRVLQTQPCWLPYFVVVFEVVVVVVVNNKGDAITLSLRSIAKVIVFY
jgi:hypothetical protein